MSVTRRTAQLVPLIQDDALVVRNPPRLIQELERLVVSEFRFELTMMRGRRTAGPNYTSLTSIGLAHQWCKVLWIIMGLTGYGRMVSKTSQRKRKASFAFGFQAGGKARKCLGRYGCLLNWS